MTTQHAQPSFQLECDPWNPDIVEPSSQFNDAALKQLTKLMSPAVPTNVFVTYWNFAVERQNIFFRRYNRLPPPWTNDCILSEHRFTNAYRVSDRVSQYLLQKVQYNQSWSHEDLFFRTILFKFFNRIETWERLSAESGDPCIANFSPEQYGLVLEAAMKQGLKNYSAAYIMPSGGARSCYRRKHDMHLNLLARMLADDVPKKLAAAHSMEQAFVLLRSYPTIGDFLAYQYITDLNYSALTCFDEMDFVMAGPGAREGIAKCFSDLGGKNNEWIIRRTVSIQNDAFAAIGLVFQSLWGRPLHLIDCQNIFCEVAKYARVRHPEFNGPKGRIRIKQKFKALPTPISFVLPPKWGVTIQPPNLKNHVAHLRSQ